MTSVEEPAQALRNALGRPPGSAPVYALGAVNAMAARAAAEAGAHALWVSSLEVSTALGVPDANVLCVHDLSTVVTPLVLATGLPVIVDVDNAGGSVDSAVRYARTMAGAGAAAVCLEDSAFPKSNSLSSRSRQELADAELMCDQLAALRTAGRDRLLVIARTEALITGAPLATALHRAERYVEAGAEAILVHSKDPTGEQALAVAAAWDHRVPLVVVPTAFPSLTGRALGAAGFRLCIYANHLSRAAAYAMQRTAAALIDHGREDENVQLMTVESLVRLAEPTGGRRDLIATTPAG